MVLPVLVGGESRVKSGKKVEEASLMELLHRVTSLSPIFRKMGYYVGSWFWLGKSLQMNLADSTRRKCMKVDVVEENQDHHNWGSSLVERRGNRAVCCPHASQFCRV